MFDAKLEISSTVYECYNGFIGWVTEDGDASDCTWRSYQPQIPLWQASALDKYDYTRDYVAWNCNDSSQLETNDKSDSHPHGFEPKNDDTIDDNEGWTVEGDGLGWDSDGTTIAT